MPLPTTLTELAGRFKALQNPLAVQIMAVFLNGEQGGVAMVRERLGEEAGDEASRYLTDLCKAGLLLDMTPQKARFKEYSLDRNDLMAVGVAQWVDYLNGAK